MFDFSEEALDQIAVAVQEGAEGEAFRAIGFGGDVGETAARFDRPADGVAPGSSS
jgi:hypothetical protein